MSTRRTYPDRESAAAINPLISNLMAEDTLDTVAAVITDLGYFLSAIEENTRDRDELRFGQLYHLFNTCAAALQYESASLPAAKAKAEGKGGKVASLVLRDKDLPY